VEVQAGHHRHRLLAQVVAFELMPCAANCERMAAKLTRSRSMSVLQMPVEQHMGGSQTWMVVMLGEFDSK
jgi:hypothetical protein